MGIYTKLKTIIKSINDMSHKSKILIVDDEPLSAKLLAAKFSREQYETIVACSGKEALEKINEKAPDLIVLDINMPGMNGYEVTAVLKKNPDTREIPIILVTAFANAGYKARGLEAGAEECLEKPVNTTELLKKVKSLLAQLL